MSGDSREKGALSPHRPRELDRCNVLVNLQQVAVVA